MHIAEQRQANMLMAAGKSRIVRHHQLTRDERRRGDHNIAALRRFARDTVKLANIMRHAARVLINAHAIGRQAITLAEAVKKPQTQRLLQTCDAPCNRRMPHIQRGRGSR